MYYISSIRFMCKHKILLYTATIRSTSNVAITYSYINIISILYYTIHKPTLIKSEAPRLYQAAYTGLDCHRVEVLAVPVLLYLMRTHLIG